MHKPEMSTINFGFSAVKLPDTLIVKGIGYVVALSPQHKVVQVLHFLVRGGESALSP